MTERNCLICHPTSPHHVSQTAQAGTCTACHSSEIISDLNSVLEPEIFMDEQTPTPGKCSTCHLKRTKGLHHNLGFKCIICHDTDRPTAPVSIRGCENCHSVNTLHKVFTHFQVDQCVGCHSVRPDAFPLLPAGIPEIKELSVNSGGPGAVVTITGTNFGDAFDKGKVYFDEYTAVVLDWCDTSISVQVPSIAKGNYLLTVKNPAGRSNGLIFSVTSPGVITGQVCDTLGRALAGAKVIAGTRVVYTNTSGYYQINTLPQGIYTVQASLKDYLPATQAVTLLESIEIKADFILESKVPPDAIPPSAIIDLKATTVLPNQVTLAWSAATDNVGVSGYNVFRNGQLLTQTSTVPFSDNAVFPATNYQYAVQAYDAAGNKAAVSNTVLVSTPSLPVVGDTTAPTAPVLTVRRDTKSLSAQLSWQAATDNVGIARYEVYRSTSSNWGFTKINSVSAQTLSYKDSAVSEGVTYYYYLLAYDLAGNQAKSNISSVSISRRLSLIPKKNDKKFFDSEIIIKRKDQGNAKNYNSSHIGDAEYCFPDGSLCC